MSVAKEYTDIELLEILRNEDRRGLDLIYERYWKRLYLSAYSLLKDDAVSQDIVQEVLLQLWLRRGEVEISSLKSYLMASIRYKVLSYIKSAGSRKVYLEDGELERLAGLTDIADRLNENDVAKLLEEGLSGLPGRSREVFLLSRNEYLSNKEIAERLGISVKAVEAQITVALKHLRLVMGDFLFWVMVVVPALMER